MIPESKWQWFGMPAHLCVAHDCLFHLATKVGKFMVSTVGNWRPRHKRRGDSLPKTEEIGFGRLYETMVFKTKSGTCSCGCGMPNLNLTELSCNGYNSALKAQRGHLAACLKIAKNSSEGSHDRQKRT